MPEPFLYERLDAASSMDFLKKEIPDSVVRNLNPRYELRPCQIEAFACFFHCYKNDFPGKAYPLHFLFNMATGSGKTLIMAGLILYLYEQGYRNFLFFVNSTNIIEKTKDKLLNPAAIKYLLKHQFSEKPGKICPRSFPRKNRKKLAFFFVFVLSSFLKKKQFPITLLSLQQPHGADLLSLDQME